MDCDALHNTDTDATETNILSNRSVSSAHSFTPNETTDHGRKTVYRSLEGRMSQSHTVVAMIH